MLNSHRFRLSTWPGVDPGAYFLTLEASGYERRGRQGVPERELFVRGPEHHRTR